MKNTSMIGFHEQQWGLVRPSGQLNLNSPAPTRPIYIARKSQVWLIAKWPHYGCRWHVFFGQHSLVGGFNPSEKYWSIGMIIPNMWKNKNVPNHQPVFFSVNIVNTLDGRRLLFFWTQHYTKHPRARFCPWKIDCFKILPSGNLTYWKLPFIASCPFKNDDFP